MPARADRRAQEPRRVVGERRNDDPDAGQRGEPALEVLGVVEAAADVAARGKAHGHVRHELALRPPVLVRHLDHLLGRRPEVVGELRPLDDDADALVEAREAVGRAHDVVFGDRRVEDARRTELRLHALGDVEDAALLAVRDVLAPDVRVGVVSELLLERLVQRMDESHLLAGAVGQALGPGRREPRARARRSRRSSPGPGRARPWRGRRPLRTSARSADLDRAEILLGQEPGLEEELAEAGQRVGGRAPRRAPPACGRARGGPSWSANGCARRSRGRSRRPRPSGRTRPPRAWRETSRRRRGRRSG